MTNKTMNKKQKFQDELIKEVEELFPKGERCGCGRRLPCRSKALAFYGMACVFFEEAISDQQKPITYNRGNGDCI